MLDNFLPIPDAESLPFYPSVLKLVVCERHRPEPRGRGRPRGPSRDSTQTRRVTRKPEARARAETFAAAAKPVAGTEFPGVLQRAPRPRPGPANAGAPGRANAKSSTGCLGSLAEAVGRITPRSGPGPGPGRQKSASRPRESRVTVRTAWGKRQIRACCRGWAAATDHRTMSRQPCHGDQAHAQATRT